MITRLDTSGVYSSTIMPRLSYSTSLLGAILEELLARQREISQRNKELQSIDEYDPCMIRLEADVCFCVIVLGQISKRLAGISTLDTILEILPSAILVIKTVSSRLFSISSQTSCNLSELSSILGSIVMDSGTLTCAKFDFKQYNSVSFSILDQAKLIADSKINKQYPNVDFYKLENA